MIKEEISTGENNFFFIFSFLPSISISISISFSSSILTELFFSDFTTLKASLSISFLYSSFVKSNPISLFTS